MQADDLTRPSQQFPDSEKLPQLMSDPTRCLPPRCWRPLTCFWAMWVGLKKPHNCTLWDVAVLSYNRTVEDLCSPVSRNPIAPEVTPEVPEVPDKYLRHQQVCECLMCFSSRLESAALSHVCRWTNACWFPAAELTRDLLLATGELPQERLWFNNRWRGTAVCLSAATMLSMRNSKALGTAQRHLNSPGWSGRLMVCGAAVLG